jgi:hypothetical protein
MSMTWPAWFVSVTNAWAAVYSNHAALRIGITFCHFAGLMAGGGLAVAADRATLRLASASDEARLTHLQELRAVHRVVITGLVLTMASGVLMVGADLDAIAASGIFWIKMALVAVVVLNGVAMQRAERAAIAAPDVAWPRLHRAAIASLVLWFLIALAGTVPDPRCVALTWTTGKRCR